MCVWYIYIYIHILHTYTCTYIYIHISHVNETHTQIPCYLSTHYVTGEANSDVRSDIITRYWFRAKGIINISVFEKPV